MEEYKKCFENYEVSNMGNIRKKLFNGEYKILKCSIQNRGYKYFQLNRDHTRKNFLVHHLVAEFFIGPRPEKLVIDHIDKNKLNNNVENLRYITQHENCKNTDRFLKDISEEEPMKRKRLISLKYYEDNKDIVLEKKRMYGKLNKNIINEKSKIYYQLNKEKILKNHSEKYICLCGLEITKGHKKRHEQTKYHLEKINLV